jgi:hypothetical protein
VGFSLCLFDHAQGFFTALFKLSFYNELVGPSPATTSIDDRRANRRQTVFRAVKVQGWLADALS